MTDSLGRPEHTPTPGTTYPVMYQGHTIIGYAKSMRGAKRVTRKRIGYLATRYEKIAVRFDERWIDDGQNFYQDGHAWYGGISHR